MLTKDGRHIRLPCQETPEEIEEALLEAFRRWELPLLTPPTGFYPSGDAGDDGERESIPIGDTYIADMPDYD
jgi:hypothetical protein